MELPARGGRGAAGRIDDRPGHRADAWQRNLDLRAKYLEIPQARADVLTASLRANPIFYARQPSSFRTARIRFRSRMGRLSTTSTCRIRSTISHKRRARIDYASRALQVMEAQYQNEVRLAIGNLYAAFVDVLTARATVRYMKASLKGLDEVRAGHAGPVREQDRQRAPTSIRPGRSARSRPWGFWTQRKRCSSGSGCSARC